MSESDAPDCPLCMETFEIDDLHFYPCTCGYQICRFCWHRIRTDENGLCPACRKTYSEDPAEYQPLSQDELHKIKKERKQREVQQKQKLSDNRQHLSNIRVIQKHLVFVVGLSNKMADPEVLKRQEYFGKFGKILKIVINPNTNYAGPQGPSASAYITYAKEDEALRAILTINTMQPPLKIRASLGTTKYCTHYLRNTQCPKQDCMYLHDVGDMNASFTKEDMQAGKHQLFEKNLLDNFMTSMQKQKQMHKQNDTATGPDITEDTTEEAWGEEDEILDNNSQGSTVLPTKTSWAVIKDDQDEDHNSEPHISAEYPDLDSSGINVGKISRTTTPSESSTGNLDDTVENHISIDTIAVASKPSDVVEKNPIMPPPPGYTTSWSTATQDVFEEKQQPQLQTTHPNINLPIQHIQPPKTTNTTPIKNTTTAINYPWPSISDLGLSDLRINPSDDDLGFDPFNESKTGLEDLIASEKQQGLSSTQSSAPKPSFRWDSFWPSNYGSTSSMPMMMSSLSSYSLFGAVPPMSNPQVPQQMRPSRPPMNPYDIQANAHPMGVGTMPPPNIASQNPLQYRFANPQQQQQQQQQQQPKFPSPQTTPINNSAPSGLLQQQQPQSPSQNPQQYMNRFPFNISSMQQQPPQQPQQQQPVLLPMSTSSTTTTSTTVTSNTSSTDSKNWQDGLRALLPNINISFACRNENDPRNPNDPKQMTCNPPNWNGLDSSSSQPPPNPIEQETKQPQPPPSSAQIAPQAQQPLQQQQHQPPSNMASPPPGFSAISNFANEAKPSWAPSAVTSDKTSQRVPPPPPGFRKPAEPFDPAAAAAASINPATGGLLQSVVSSNIEASSSTSPVSITSNRNSQILSNTHDDPSILWSKVLSDKATKEIETTNMAFPLPGETLDQALNSVGIPSINPQPNNQQQMMSWNSVVSGNQYGSKTAVSESTDLSNINTKPLEISSKETKDGSSKPQKPSPIFGNQQKAAVKKPTAHVKPLKCTAPSDGFTTVQNSRQTTGNVHTGSRVSELDDFSTDLPVPIILNTNVTANIVSNFVDYPPVTSAAPAKTGGKKKKKKGKEQSGTISEVIVGVTVTERPPVQPIFDEERPKKGGKNKKKGKASPPSQRKLVDDDAQKTKEQQQQQQIRILTSDGNSRSTPHSPTQAVAGNFVNSSGNSSQHDQEIVSRLTESTEKLLKNVLFETEAIKLNTEQISKDLKSALEKCKESSLSLSDLEKINLLLTPGKFPVNDLDDSDLVDTTDLERQVESARREAKMLEARLNDVIRKNMASELETLKRNTKSS